MTSIERNAVASLGALYAVRMLGLFMVLPVIAIYLGAYQGASPSMIGFALGAYGLTQALFQIPFGLWSDKWGRKPVITIGLLIFGVGSVIAASADSALMVVVGRAIQGSGAVASTVLALVADLTRDEQRTKAMAMIGMSIGLTFALSLVLGPAIASAYGLSGLFWFTALLAAVAIGVLWLVVPSPISKVNKELSPVGELFGRVLADVNLRRLNIGIFSLHFVLTALFSVLPLLLVDVLEIKVQNHWQVYLPVLGLSFVVMIPAMIYADKKGKLKKVFCSAVGVLLLAILVLCFGFNSAAGLIAGLFVFFVAFNLLEALLPSLVSRQVFAGGKGTAMGVYSTCQFMGIFAGGATSGMVLMTYGAGGVFILCAGVLLIWLLAAYGMQAPLVAKTIVIPYGGGASLSSLNQKIGLLAGVVDVMTDSATEAIYIKTDPNKFNRESVDSLIAANG